MQWAGLLIGPLAVLLQVTPANPGGKPMIDLKQMLAMGVAALCLFYIGRIVEGFARG